MLNILQFYLISFHTSEPVSDRLASQQHIEYNICYKVGNCLM